MASAEPSVGAPPRQMTESLLISSSRGLRRAYDNHLAGVDLNLSEAYLLGHVHTHGPMTQTQLAERLGLGRAATGALIDSLERKGLVERSAHAGDRRVWLVATTEAAAEVVQAIRAIDVALREQIWSGISRAERNQLTAILLRVEDNLTAILNNET